MAVLAAGWLPGITNADLRREALAQLRGATNAALRDPFLRLATADPDANVRERAVQNLENFITDPQVEDQLWQTFKNDSDDDVRSEARKALTEGRMTESRAASLRERSVRPESTIEERAVAWLALREAGQNAPELSAQLAALAQTTADPAERISLFRAFDDQNDPAFVPPLIQGLQDANPLVRERAADALSDFRSDPNIQQWLRYVAENDADPVVRRQAYRVIGR